MMTCVKVMYGAFTVVLTWDLDSLQESRETPDRCKNVLSQGNANSLLLLFLCLWTETAVKQHFVNPSTNKHFMFFFFPSILNTDNEHLTFRGNSIATKAMEAYMKLVGEKVSILLYFICFFEQQLFVITFILLYLFVHIICNVPISETWSW